MLANFVMTAEVAHHHWTDGIGQYPATGIVVVFAAHGSNSSNGSFLHVAFDRLAAHDVIDSSSDSIFNDQTRGFGSKANLPTHVAQVAAHVAQQSHQIVGSQVRRSLDQNVGQRSVLH